MSFHRTHFVLWGSLLTAALVGRSSHAATDEERAGARATANQGADAFEQGKWAAAVELFTRAEALVHSPIHLWYLARAQMKLGRWVEAYELFNRIKRESVTAPVPAPVANAIADSNRALATLDAEMPNIVVTVKGADPKSATVTMDGAAVPNALLGVFHPVNPGPHKFRASSATEASGETSVDMKPSSRQSVELTMTPTAAAPASAAPLVPVPRDASVSPTVNAPASPERSPADAKDRSSSGSGLRAGGYVGLGVGVVGVGLGTVFLLTAHSKQKQADDAFEACGGRECPLADRGAVDSLDSSAASKKSLALTGFLLGGIGAATGVTLLVLSGKHHSNESASEPSARIQPWLGYRSLGVSGCF